MLSYAPLYQLVKLVKSFAIPRSALTGCQECWYKHKKRQGKQSPLISCTNMTLKVRDSCHRLSWGMKPGSTIFNLIQRHNCTICHVKSPKGEDWTVCCQLEKSWLRTFSMKKLLFLWTSWLGEQQWTPTTMLKHKEVWMLAFIKSVPQEKYPNCCSSTTMLGHTQMCTPQMRPQNWLKIAALSTQQSWSCTFRLSHIWSLNKKPVRTPLHQVWGTASGYRGGTTTFSRQEYILLFEGVKRLLTKMETTMKNKYGFSNAVVKVLGNFHMSNL